MVRNYKPKKKLYTETSIAAAIEEVKHGGTVYKTAKKYHMSISMLRKRVLEEKGEFTRKKQGRKTDLTPAIEEHLADCIKRMSELGKHLTFQF